MKKTRIILSLVGLICFVISCNNSQKGYKTHDSGLKYKFIEQNENALKPKIGDILEISMQYSNENDSVIEISDFFRMQLNEPSHTDGSIEDGLALMRVGDSAHFLIDAFSFYTKTRKVEMPEFIVPGSNLKFHIKLLNFLKYEDFEQERRSLNSKNSKEEIALLNSFIKITNINIEPTSSGLYYIEQEEGRGKSPQPGNKVAVNYLGYFVDGKIFDSSYERNEAFEFVFGAGEVIQGLDEGVSKMKEGGKAKLIIPSYLAYGEQGRGPVPPFSTLIFEIELLKVE
ncbi:MAG: FKBP-type peptidyl-prolyl cis-trans isomerase [Bacteroidales bacterium]|nr:FKBP-type peptidyl-prolyl cis-trans isomerase [Bacteroidales bacterium]